MVMVIGPLSPLSSPPPLCMEWNPVYGWSSLAMFVASGAIILAKLSVVPVRRGYWGRKVGAPHTVPVKVRKQS